MCTSKCEFKPFQLTAWLFTSTVYFNNSKMQLRQLFFFFFFKRSLISTFKPEKISSSPSTPLRVQGKEIQSTFLSYSGVSLCWMMAIKHPPSVLGSWDGSRRWMLSAHSALTCRAGHRSRGRGTLHLLKTSTGWMPPDFLVYQCKSARFFPARVIHPLWNILQSSRKA